MSPEIVAPPVESARNDLLFKIHEYLNDESVVARLRQNTIMSYCGDLTSFAEFCKIFAISNLKQLTPEIVASWQESMQRAHYSDTTIARKTTAVKGFVNWEIASGNLSPKFLEKISLPKITTRPKRSLTPEEIQKLTDFADKLEKSDFWGLRDILCIYLAKSAMRSEQIVALNLGNINIGTEGTVSLQVKDNHNQPQTINLDYQTSQFVIKYLKGYGWVGGQKEFSPDIQKEPLLVNKRGSRLTRQGFWLIIRKFGKSAGIRNLTPAVLRHTRKKYSQLNLVS